MDDSRAQELRDAFERLPDAHVFTLAEVEFVAAVLGRGINWVYSSGDGHVLVLSAFGEPVVTAEDLRSVAREHPRTDEGNGGDDGLGKAIGEAIVAVYQAVKPTEEAVPLNRA